jgi:SagB-type dehydrogenase family enzyme
MQDRESVVAIERSLRSIAAGKPAARTPRLRRSHTLVIMAEESTLMAYDYLGNLVSDALRPDDLTVLRIAARWSSPAALVKRSKLARASGAATVRKLLRGGFLLVEGTRAAAEDERFAADWEWDLRAGMFHLSTKDSRVRPESDELVYLADLIENNAPIDLYTKNDPTKPIVALKRPKLASRGLELLAKRRTRRFFDAKPITTEQLGDCLYAGLGITGFVLDAVPKYGKLPLKLAPSGGARNPYEAYVMANAVTGLPRGFYHYSAYEHSLGLVSGEPLPVPQDILGHQEWYDRAPAIVFLVASFKRSQWKYKHPMVYRAVMIEAGHIGQNIMLAATSHGLSCSPTGLCADRTIEDLLGLDHVMQGIPYVIGIGHTRKTGMDWGTFERHP